MWPFTSFSRSRPAQGKHRTRLSLEQLETRDTPAIFSVTTLADAGMGSLRDCITQANASMDAENIITFDPMLPSGSVILESALPTIENNMSITANGRTIRRSPVEETPDFRIFTVESGTLDLYNMEIRNGKAVDGGGILVGDATCNLYYVYVARCEATTGSGGGIWNEGGVVTLENSEVIYNTAGNKGGGIFNNDGGTLTIGFDSYITNNTAVNFGGGIYNEGATATISFSTISNNTASHEGGGIVNTGTLVLSYSELSSNTAAEIGGLSCFGANNATLTSVTISNNRAIGGPLGQGKAGGFFVGANANLSLTGCTVSDNEALVGTTAGGWIEMGGTWTATGCTIPDSIQDDN